MNNIHKLNKVFNLIDDEQLQGMSYNLQEVDSALQTIGKFVYDNNFSKIKIRELKTNLNSLSIFKNINNKCIFRLCKQFKKSNVQYGGVTGILSTVKPPGLFYENPSDVPFTRKLDQFSLILDILSFIPYYGNILELLNFMLYFIRGDYEDCIYSLISAIPTIGAIIGVPMKYIFKYFENKKPGYNKYYKSLISLKQATKEIQSFELNNTDLDNPLNDTFEYEIYDP